MNKGEIFRCDEYDHPFVYLEDINEIQFKGTMVTSSDHYPNYNLPFQRSHIREQDNEGNRFHFQYTNSYFVFALLVKRNNVSGLQKIGELTPDGIEYVESTLVHERPIEWSEYTLNQFTS